jgi:aryl-alcohol dehydrogenase-like predicted oxidoreductase
MEYVRFGNSGLKVSKLCLGLWHLPPLKERDIYGVYKVDEEESIRIIKKAIDLGVNFIDTANIYHGTMQGPDYIHAGKAEEVLGKAIRGYDRESLVISTKVRGRMAPWPNGEGLSRKHIRWQIRESLRRLGTDYVDVYLMHRPDPSTPIEETLDALKDLVTQGLVHYVSESYFHPDDIQYIYEYSRSIHLPFIAMQEPYNLIERDIEKDKIPLAKKYGLGIMAYIPLAQGVLTGKYLNGIPEMSRASYVDEIRWRYLTPETLKAMREFHELAKELGVTDAQLALAWILRKSEELGITIIPIIGVTSVAQLEDNLGSLDVKLSGDVMSRLEEISRMAKVNWEVRYDRVIKLNSP